MKSQIKRRRFTLYEILIALIMIAVIVPTALAAISVAANIENSGERKLKAARIGMNYINELIVTGDWENVDTEGDFGDDYPGYSWAIETTEWDETDTVLILTMTVYYMDKGVTTSVVITVPVKAAA